MNSITHHGVKGMHWGVRKDEFSRSVNKAMGSFLGIENKHLNKMLRSSGKLRKAYFEAQTLGVKTKKGKYQYNKESKELYQKQQAAAKKAQKYAKEFLEKYKTKPMSYLESLNAQRGAAIGTAVGIAVPVVLPLWATIPAGYYIGSHVGSDRVKHSDELMHHGVKGMKWHEHKKAKYDNRLTKINRVAKTPNMNFWSNMASQFYNGVNRTTDRGSQLETTVTNLFNNRNYSQSLSTLFTAYTTDRDARYAINHAANNVLDRLSNDSDWKVSFIGNLGSNVFNLFGNTFGRQRRGTRAEVAAYETQMQNNGNRGRRPTHSNHSSSHSGR